MNTTDLQTTNLAAMASSAPRLDTAGIAALLGLSREHVTDRLTKRVDFPKPYINVSRRTRYWRTTDVLKWMGGKQGSVGCNAGATTAHCPPSRARTCP